jgi:hypothetical protein
MVKNVVVATFSLNFISTLKLLWGERTWPEGVHRRLQKVDSIITYMAT